MYIAPLVSLENTILYHNIQIILKDALSLYLHSRESGNPAFSLWTPALGSRKAGSLAEVTSSIFVFRNRY